MWPDRNPGPLTYQSGALPTALLGPAILFRNDRTLQGVGMKMVELLPLKFTIHLKNKHNVDYMECCFNGM